MCNSHVGKSYDKPEKLGHVMVDLETLGTEPGDVILSIGAVEFDLATGKTGKEFYKKISLESSLKVGLKIDPDTFKWWMHQADQSRAELFTETESINEVLFAFTHFIINMGLVDVWSNGSGFDLVLLAAAYRKFETKEPWEFNRERDVRTLVSLRPQVKKDIAFKGIKHHPLADCRHQIEYCCEIYHQLGIKIGG